MAVGRISGVAARRKEVLLKENVWPPANRRFTRTKSGRDNEVITR